jgi:transposase
MPRKRLSMRSISEILRLRWEAGLSLRQIATSCRRSPATVREYLLRAETAHLRWPLPEELEEEALERLLFPPSAPSRERRPEPDWEAIHQQLRRKGVTLGLLWQEYKAQHPSGYQHSRFCQLYHAWAGRLDPVLRQQYAAGEKLFVDYAGMTVPIVDRSTGEVREAQVFVAVSGASNYTYVEATWSQGLCDWISAHRRCFEFMGGVHALIVPDNLKSGVRSPCFYEPELNRTYQELAEHYGTAILPTRVRRPRDKAKVETGVQGVERWLLAPLRDRRFFALSEFQADLRERLRGYNRRPFQKLEGCRESLFLALERPLLRPLPAQPYEYAEWCFARVNIDYHIEVGRHYYSVPHSLLREQVEVRLTEHTVEIFHHRRRVASHPRSALRGRHTTTPEHMPQRHRAHAEWSPSRLIEWAQRSGPATAHVVEHLLTSRPHPEQGYRSCLGLLRLGRQSSAARLEAACGRALALGAPSYRSIASILQRGLEAQPLPEVAPAPTPLHHAHVRGADYYKEVTHAAPTDAGQASGTETDRNAESLSGTAGAPRLPGVEL